MKKLLLFAVYVASGLSTGIFAQPEISGTYSGRIQASDMKTILYKLASDEFEGRETAEKGQKLAAAYIAEQFKSAGLKEGANGSYLQNYSLMKSKTVSYRLSGGKARFKQGKNLFVTGADRNIQFSSPYLELVSNETDSTESQDEFAPNSIAVLFMKKNSEGNERIPYARLKQIKKRNPVAVFVVASEEKTLKRFKGTPNSTGLELSDSKEEEGAPVFVFGFEGFTKIMGMMKIIGVDKNETARRITLEEPVTGEVVCEHLSFSADNVIGVIEGSDKKSEYVFITAHYDHLGKRGDKIYYGADDDGSGTTAVIEIAEAFAKAKQEGHGPRRSVVCMTLSGEEKGLLGSHYFVTHPTVGLDSIVADLNIDMIGRVDAKHKEDSNYVYVIGSDKLSSELHAINEDANAQYAGLALDYTFNDPQDRNRFYYRSDHYNFAKNNIPVIFYFNGVHEDYHKPTDTPDKISFSLMEKRAQLVFQTAWELANREQRIVIDSAKP